MTPSFAYIREFIRRVYRDGGATSETRASYLDGLADTALDSMGKGRMLTGSADKGTSATYSAFAGWNPDLILALIDEVRDYITESTATAAITAYNGRPIKGVVTLGTSCRWNRGLVSLT